MADRPLGAVSGEPERPWSAGAPGALPVELTTFVGRDAALAEITRLASSSRLLTITGPGGCGKSRLALQVAPTLAADLTCRPVWVGLATLTDPALVPHAIARALDAPERPGSRPIDVLIEALAAPPMLLVFDNCEHLIDAVAETVDTLLRCCLRLRVLATSREPLNIAGETAWAVPPLGMPVAGAETVEGVGESEVGRLFVDRARAAQPGFALTPENAPVVAGICRRLDGMPLAIELAAARVRVLSVDDIDARLERSFEVLTAGRRMALPRHRTLRATIDWSYDLLTEPERRLFERLAVFVGGFCLEAGEAVGAGDDAEAAEVLDLLARLVDRSLVVAEERAGVTRYRLLEVMRQYGRERLAARGEEADIRDRHARWYGAFARRASGLSGSDQAVMMRRIDVEYSNLRAAMQWTLERGDASAEAEIATSLWLYWLMRGHLAEGLHWLRAGLPGLAEGTPLRAHALNGAGVMSCHRAEYQEAHTYFVQAQAIWHALGDADGEASNLYGIATAADLQGDYALAAAAFEESLTLAVEPRRRALSLMGLATIALYRAEERAGTLAAKSLELLSGVDDARSAAAALTVLGIVALEAGRLDEAARLCGESLEQRRALGDRGGAAHTLNVLGAIALRRDDAVSAGEYYREAAGLRREMGEAGGLPAPLEGLGAAAVISGQLIRAVRLFSAADALRGRIATPATPLERRLSDHYLADLRDRVDGASFAEAWRWGQDAALEVVVAEALRTDLTETARAALGGDVPPERSPGRTPDALEITGLGSAHVVRAGHELRSSDWTYARSRELLFYLLTHSPATKEQIGLALWPDASSAQLRSAFHSTVHHLRHALGDPAWILLSGGRYAFNRSLPYRYDVDEFEAEIAHAEHLRHADPVRAAALLESAVGRYAGDFLAGAAEADWTLARQDALRQQCLDALLLLGALLRSDDPARAARAYRRAVALDPYLEVAHRGLMRCYARQGQRGLALRHYRDLEVIMRDELDAAPDPETFTLFQQLQHGESID